MVAYVWAMETGKLIEVGINDKLIHAQISEYVTLITADNLSDCDVQPDRSWSLNVGVSLNTEKFNEDMFRLSRNINNIKVEITIDGKVVERQIKSCGSKMVRKIERNKAYARPVIYYIEEFYCKF